MKVIKPPQSIVSGDRLNWSIFLAGSIEMGTAENWQDKVEKHFEGNPFYTILNPRRDDWDSSWEQEFENPQFYQQVSWELNALDKATHILMYFSPETKSPISLLELGLYAKSEKMVVVCPEGFWRRGNVEIVCEKYGIPFYSDLDEALKRFFSKNTL